MIGMDTYLSSNYPQAITLSKAGLRLPIKELLLQTIQTL